MSTSIVRSVHWIKAWVGRHQKTRIVGFLCASLFLGIVGSRLAGLVFTDETMLVLSSRHNCAISLRTVRDGVLPFPVNPVDCLPVESNSNSARWSPDGKQIVYAVYFNLTSSVIRIMDLDERSATTVSSFCNGNINSLAWSPDGKQIAYVGWSDPNVQPNLCVFNVHNNISTRIGSGYWPTWSPDSTRIIYLDYESDETCLKAVDADGGNHRSLLCGSIFWISWSPDGKWILFARYQGNTGELDIMSPDGQTRRVVPLLKGVSVHAPVWSPDGKQIAYIGGDSQSIYHLFVTNIDGNGRQLSDMEVNVWIFPSWSPDGTKIAFVSQNQSLYLLDVASGLAKVASVHDSYGYIAWQPNQE